MRANSLILKETLIRIRNLDQIKSLSIAIPIAIIGIFYLSTIREGHQWAGDFGLYIHHAKNIVEGVSYQDTGYIYNPFVPALGPETYPPIFPLVLSPIYKWFGLNFTPMKVEIILLFLAFLFIFSWSFRNELPFQFLVASIAVIGFNPYFWDFSHNVLSDIPFLFFAYLSLFFIEQAYQSHKSQKSQLLYASLAGLFIYLAYGTRSAGIVLIPSLLIYDIIKHKKPTLFAVMATFICILFIALQSIFLHMDSSYFDSLQIGPRTVFSNLVFYTRRLSDIWDNGYSKIFRGILFVIICGSAIIGYLTRVKDRITIFEIFLPLYILLIMIWPLISLRLFMPVMPLYIFYAFVGVGKIDFFRRKEIKRFAFIILLMIILISYAGKYTTVDFGPIGEVDKREALELFDYIKANTRDEDVFIFRRPRPFSLYTDRNASTYHQPDDDKELWDYFHKIGATYLIVGPDTIAFLGWHNSPYLRLFVEKYKDDFEEIYSNSDFNVYKIKNVSSDSNAFAN